MTKKNSADKYLSYEQLKAELFPALVELETAEKRRKNAELYGGILADRTIDQMLTERKILK